MTAYEQLPLSELAQAVAWFDAANLHLSFDSEALPFADSVAIGSSAPIPIREALATATDLSRWQVALSNVPPSVLAHELAHVFHTATTPAGLRLFYEGFVLEHALGMALTHASTSTSSLPVGLTALYGPDPEVWPEAYRIATALEQSMALRIGGMTIRCDDEDSAEQVAAAFPLTQFYIREGDTRSSPVNLRVAGLREVFEGFGAAVEMLRCASEDDLEVLPAGEPYYVFLEAYKRIRPEVDGLAGTLHEFAVVLDTALLTDTWLQPDEAGCSPAVIFMRLLNSLADTPKLRLETMHYEDVGRFQNYLLRSLGASGRTVESVCAEMRSSLSAVFASIRDLTSTPSHILDDFERCIDTFQRFRLEFFRGACPLEVLIDSHDRWLLTLATNVPSGNNGPEFPIVDGDAESSQLFLWQQARHFRPVLKEVGFGRRPCAVRTSCVLPRREACEGVTDNLVPAGTRCAREAVIATVMRTWKLESLFP